MHWFQLRTITKIPGTYPNGFWTTLLLQTSRTEPAIFHALLTLSSAHRSEGREESMTNPLTSHEQNRFMLHNYSKAISCLQPHFNRKVAASSRVILVVCIVFTCLEFLRGNFKTAQAHLQNGLTVLQETNGYVCDGIMLLRAKDVTELWILEMFHRLHVQVELFHHTHHEKPSILLSYTPEAVITHFQSVKDAWTELDRILYKIMILKGSALRTNSPDIRIHQVEFLPHQLHIHNRLDEWRTMYESFRPTLGLQDPTFFLNAMITNYYTLALILCSTSLSTELAYDSETSHFVNILSNSIHLWKLRPVQKVQRMRHDGAHSTVDFGWVPPLYYTAIKCRIRAIRIHAVRLLESTFHREGIWDCWIGSRVARKVMEMEDGELYKNQDLGTLPLDAVPEIGEQDRPTLPLERRWREIKVQLEDEMADNVVVAYKVGCHGEEWERVSVSLMDSPANVCTEPA